MGRNKRKPFAALLAISAFLVLWGPNEVAMAMHISEGILPARWAALWFALSLLFLVPGSLAIVNAVSRDKAFVSRIALAGALVFVISVLPIPVPVSGTCSHPCGTPLASILIGPLMSPVMGSIALLLQALLLGHGGLTTWGANVFSMGVVGSMAGYAIYRVARRWGGGVFLAGFLAGSLGDLLVYLTTAIQLASGVPSGSGFLEDLGRIVIAFLPTQLPLAVIEGMLTGGILTAVFRSRPEILESSPQGLSLSFPFVKRR